MLSSGEFRAPKDNTMAWSKAIAHAALAVLSVGCGNARGSGDAGLDAPTVAPDVTSSEATQIDARASDDIVTTVDSMDAPVVADGDGGTTTLPPDDNSNGVMLQAFYWNVPTTTAAGSWWLNLASHADEWAAAGITSVWIPPPYKGAGGHERRWLRCGYDRYDLGEFNQRGTVATRYGTRAELLTAVGTLHGAGSRVYADMVMNHMMGGDRNETVTLLDGTSASVPTGFDFTARGGAYSTYVWDSTRFNGVQAGCSWNQWHAWDFAPYLNGQAYDSLLGTEIRYADAENQAEMIHWGMWLTDTLSLDGYRLDATKHMYTTFINSWLDALVTGTDRFAVSEAVFGDIADLESYVAMTGTRTRVFDYPLHYLFVSMSNGGASFDMRMLGGSGFTAGNSSLSVPFVDNHDTDNPGALYSPVVNHKMLAFAFILVR